MSGLIRPKLGLVRDLIQMTLSIGIFSLADSKKQKLGE